MATQAAQTGMTMRKVHMKIRFRFNGDICILLCDLFVQNEVNQPASEKTKVDTKSRIFAGRLDAVVK